MILTDYERTRYPKIKINPVFANIRVYTDDDIEKYNKYWYDTEVKFKNFLQKAEINIRHLIMQKNIDKLMLYVFLCFPEIVGKPIYDRARNLLLNSDIQTFLCQDTNILIDLINNREISVLRR